VPVCPRAYFWNRWIDFHEFFVQIRGRGSSSSGGVTIRYVFPVLWMTSRLAEMGGMAMRGRLNLSCTITSSVAIPRWRVHDVYSIALVTL